MAQNDIVLVINCGSSSLKYELYLMPEERSLGKGIVEKIGSENGTISQKKIIVKKTNSEEKKMKKTEDIPNHGKAIELVFEALVDKEYGLIDSLSEITAVGHRVVHGGDIKESVIIDKEIIKHIENYSPLAPLHNPPNLTGISEIEKKLPGLFNVAVFDTSFHQTMDEVAYLYAIDPEYHKKYKIRRYGFHGTSHKFVYNKAHEMLKSNKKLNIITAHLGNGSSISAIKEGKVIDTTMGFSPLEGLMMGTRSGDIDPAVIFFMQKNLNMSVDEIDNLLNKKSGVLAISGVSNDFRELWSATKNGNDNAKLALEMFCYRAKKYVGALRASLGETNALVFTGGIGENDWDVRRLICRGLESLGIEIDYNENDKLGKNPPGIISKPKSKTTILVIPTNEELQIAKDTYDLKNNR